MPDLIPKETFRTAWEQYWLSFQQSPAKVFWNAEPTEAAQDAALFKAHLDPGLPLVDVGCGNGEHTRALACQSAFTKIIGTDIAPAAVASARNVGGRGISYRVLDLLRPDDAVALHREIGDANVHIRGVLHQLPDAHRQTAVVSIAHILGGSGALYLKELAAEADLYLQDLLKRFGPVQGLERILDVLGKAGISWGSFGEADIQRLFPSDRFSLLVNGDSRIQTTNRLPSGEIIAIPAIYAVLRPNDKHHRARAGQS